MKCEGCSSHQGILVKSCLSIMACLLAVIAPAQDARGLRLPDYLSEVLRSNLDAAAERFKLSSAQAQIAINRLLPDPELSLGVSSKELYGPNKAESPTESYLGLSWTLELGGKRSARVLVAQSELKKTQAELEVFLGELRTAAIEAFADALKARLALERKQKTLEGFKELLRLNEIRYKTGDIGGVELTQSRLEARRFEGDVFAAQADLEAANAHLLQLLGRDQGPVQLQGSLEAPIRSFSMEALLAKALTQRPELLMAQQNLKVAESQKRLAQANRWVDMGLNLGINHTPPVYPKGLDPEGFPAPPAAHMSNSLSFGITIPIPLSRHQKGEWIQAENSRLQAKFQLQSQEQKTRADLLAALARVEALSKQLAAYHSGILQDSNTVLQGLLFSYKRGNATLLEWINAQRTDDEVHLAHLETQASHLKALAALDRVCGTAYCLESPP